MQHKIENESSIKILINEEAFKEYEGVVDLICIFDNKCRLSERSYQIKETIEKNFILSSYKNYFVPIVRTKSKEYITPVTSTRIVKTTFRKIIYHEKNLRISLNKIESNDGIFYTCAGEIEYNENDSYENVIKFEHNLMRLLYKWFKYIKFDDLSNHSLFEFFSPKIQPIIFVNFENSYKWAYKWNGIKGKMLCLENQFVLAPDMQNVQIINFSHHIFEQFRNICVQVELLDDYIIIVECLGVIYDNQIHLMEPHGNMKFLNYLINAIGNEKIYIEMKDLDQNLKKKELLIQKYYDSKKIELPSEIYNNFYDGFLINQKNILYKVKYPTVDVKYLGKNEFQVGNSTILRDIQME